MALPLIPKKFFNVTSKFLPKGKLTLSPITTGLETVLLQVKDSSDEKEQLDAIKQIIESCMETKGVDVGAIPYFMIEELFVRLMQNSVNELIDLSYTCNTEAKDNPKPCGTKIDLTLDLREFKVKETAGHTNIVIVADPIGIQFKYPNIDMSENKSNIDTIIQCIDIIFDGDDVHTASSYTEEEVKTFWEQLTLSQKKEVFDKFFDTIPHMHFETKIKCSKCGTIHPMEFNSVIDLFL